ncbi:MAG TPA: cytochrome c [Vicinamibacterales bacterium]|nr:cytochrome c [Vicinamibacterales bacterium]
MNRRLRGLFVVTAVVWMIAMVVPLASSEAQGKATPPPATFGLGRAATAEEIAARDIDIGPDGEGLPPGRGTAAEGAAIYAAQCASCHGKTGKEGPNDVLVGRHTAPGFNFAQDPALPRTIGTYWPYATTVFDYIRRAMPPATPGSLTDNEVYALVAHLLVWNELIAADSVMDAASLLKVRMPARDRFVPDTRGTATMNPGARTPAGQPPLPKGQMPDLGRHTQQDDKVPLFDFDAYFLGRWTFEWDMPEGPLGEAGRVEGITIYTKVADGEYEALTDATGPDGTFTVKETIRYQREQKTLTREVADSRGFTYTQTGTIGGDLGGFYTIYFESAPFMVKGEPVRLKHAMRLTSPLAHRVSTTVSVKDGAFRNYGTPWWSKAPAGSEEAVRGSERVNDDETNRAGDRVDRPRPEHRHSAGDSRAGCRSVSFGGRLAQAAERVVLRAAASATPTRRTRGAGRRAARARRKAGRRRWRRATDAAWHLRAGDRSTGSDLRVQSRPQAGHGLRSRRHPRDERRRSGDQR